MMTDQQFNQFCADTRIGDTFVLQNGDRRMVIGDGENFACLDPDSGIVTTDWYKDKKSLLDKFKTRIP